MSVKKHIIKVSFCFKFQKAVKPKIPEASNIKCYVVRLESFRLFVYCSWLFILIKKSGTSRFDYVTAWYNLEFGEGLPN